MRLFLASEELGGHADALRRMAGEGRKALFITNAHDYYEPERRVEYVDRKSRCLIDAGFEVTELDLRKYFDKAEELKAFVDDYVPDVVFSIGGNVFLLRTAMKLSGMDEIIKEGVRTTDLSMAVIAPARWSRREIYAIMGMIIWSPKRCQKSMASRRSLTV